MYFETYRPIDKRIGEPDIGKHGQVAATWALAIVLLLLSLGLCATAHAADNTISHSPRANWKGFTAGVTISGGGVLQRGASRWVTQGAVRLGWVVLPGFEVLLQNSFSVNTVTAGPNNARFYMVSHAPILLIDIWRGLYAKGGLGLAYMFERGDKNQTRYGFLGVMGLGYRFLERKRFWMSAEFEISPIIMDGDGNHYLFNLGLAFQFY